MKLLSLLCLACASISFVSGTLQSDLTGKGFNVVFPGDNEYTNASLSYNLRFAFKPAVITFPSTPQQVSDIVKIGAKYNRQVVARSGRHSYIANGSGGKDGVVVVDMGGFTNISVSSSGTTTIQPGNRLGEVVLALGSSGRAIPLGVCPYVGFGGLSAYGGYGFMGRMWGLTLDNIVSIDLVLANGQITTASQTKNSDLFWALRGSGGSFGIITSYTVNTFAAPQSSTGIQIFWSLSAAAAAKGLESWNTFVHSGIPRQFGGEILLLKGPAQGNVTFSLRAAYYGDASQVNSTIAPFLKTLPAPLSSTFTTGTYGDVANLLGGKGTLSTKGAPDSPDTFYAKSLTTFENAPLTSGAQNAFMSYLANEGFVSNTSWFVEVELYGGTNSAINAVPLDATAFAHRNSLFNFQFYASSSTFLPPYPSDGFTFLDGMANSIIKNSPSNWQYGAYVNYLDNRLSDWQLRYYGSHYARLQQLKRKYDPRGLFSFPTSIQE